MKKTIILLLIALPLLTGLLISATNIATPTGSKEVIHITDKTFDTTINKGVVIVDFWATWCGPCRRQGPILKKVAMEMGGKVTVAKLDVDHNKVTSRKYGIRSIPTMIIFKNGKAVERITGLTAKDKLIKYLKAHLD